MSRLLAIDPGCYDSAYVVIDHTCRPLDFGKIPNPDLLARASTIDAGLVAIESVASYGMPVGEEVFETVRWAGRFEQRLLDNGRQVELVKRLRVKLALCHNAAAKDSNIRQALCDRFAMGVRNYGRGTKADPGWFYGFHRDVWAGYALAVTVMDAETVPF
jgi:hypothetical protein